MRLSSDTLLFAAIAVAIVAFLIRRVVVARVRSAQARAAVAKGAKLVDVRTPGEFSSGHLDGAVNIPLDQLSRRHGELGSKKRPVVVYCHSGSRSAMAARTLQVQGFEEVIDLGPMWAWGAAKGR